MDVFQQRISWDREPRPYEVKCIALLARCTNPEDPFFHEVEREDLVRRTVTIDDLAATIMRWTAQGREIKQAAPTIMRKSVMGL